MLFFRHPTEDFSKRLLKTKIGSSTVKRSFKGKLIILRINTKIAGKLEMFKETKFLPKNYGRYVLSEIEKKAKM